MCDAITMIVVAVLSFVLGLVIGIYLTAEGELDVKNEVEA